MKSFDINYKINALERYFKNNKSIDINSEYEEKPVGEWFFQIKHAIKMGEVNIENIHGRRFLKYIKRNVNHSKERAERLIHFVSKYEDLWYPNARDYESKLNDITDNEDEQELISFLYGQARNDYDALRAIRSRFFEWRKNKGKDGLYDIDDETFERIRNAGVGRTFGLSDKKQKEYDRLVEQCGLDKETADYIFKNFSSYEKFKEMYAACVAKHDEVNLIPKHLHLKANYVTCIDISNGNHTVSKEYIYLLKAIMGVDFLIFDGTNLDERMKSFLEDNPCNAKYPITEKEREAIYYYFGIGRQKLCCEEIATIMNVSGTRAGQLRNRAISKMRQNRKYIEDIVYITDEDEILNFMVEFFQKYDVFQADGIKSITIDENEVNSNECLTGVTRNLKSNISAILEKQGYVASKIKEEIQRKIDNLNAIPIEQLLLQNFSIDYLDLSSRAYNCLLRNDITTVGNIIKLSRESKYPIKSKIRYMGDTTYKELIHVIGTLNLTLEDVDKGQSVFEKNNELLEKPSVEDTTCLWLYLKTIQYEIDNKYLSQDDKDKLSEQVLETKDKMKIDISKEKEFDIIQSRIQKLDYKFNRCTGIQILDLPGCVKDVLKSYNIRSIVDIYKVAQKDNGQLEHHSGTYFDLVEAELKRMGLQFPAKETLSTDLMNSATYLNAYNVDLIRFFINKSDLSNEDKQLLRESLLRKITMVSEQTTDTADKKLSNKIEELAQMYTLLEEKKKELADKLELIDKNNNPDFTDLE